MLPPASVHRRAAFRIILIVPFYAAYMCVAEMKLNSADSSLAKATTNSRPLPTASSTRVILFAEKKRILGRTHQKAPEHNRTKHKPCTVFFVRTLASGVCISFEQLLNTVPQLFNPLLFRENSSVPRSFNHIPQ